MKSLFKKTLILMTLFISSSSAFAYDSFQVEYFSFVVLSENTCAVSGYYNRVTVDDIIPSEVTYNKKKYSVTTIGDYAFANCNLTDITIPSSVTTIGGGTFDGCTNLTNITIPNSVTTIGGRAFNGCIGLTNITIPNSVTTIEYSAFNGCIGLTNITIPNSVTTIGNGAFNGCIGLTNITIPNSVTTIGNGAFNGCIGLTNITIPNSVTTIGNGAFNGCIGLTNITIPNSVTTIGNGAFNGCIGLTNITIPNSVTTIGDYAFGGCGLRSATIGTGVQQIGLNAFCQSNSCKFIWLTNTPPIGYKRISDNFSHYNYAPINYVANDSYKDLKNVTIYPHLSSLFEVDGIKYVPVNPSERTCDAIDCTYDSTITVANISTSVKYKGVEFTVKEIKPYICYNNDYLDKINISFNGGNIGHHAFYDCDGITKADITAKAIGYCAFTSCHRMMKVALKETLESVGDHVFEGCTNLQEIDIPNSVTNMGMSCFAGCNGLSSVHIGSGLRKIEESTFSDCSLLADFTIPKNVDSIQNNVFKGCKSLTKVTIADRDTELALGCNPSTYKKNPLFCDCPLKNIYIGGNITYQTSSAYGYSPFYRNTSLETVKITDNETEISENEFYGCTNLKNVTIGNGIKTIGDYAFSGCASLESFSFGTSLESIGKEAFSDCISITKLVAKAEVPPTCGDQALADINKWTCTLYVPSIKTDAYKAAEQWKDFFFYDTIETGVKGLKADSTTETERFSIDGTRLTTPQKGINIIRMNDGTTRKVRTR